MTNDENRYRQNLQTVYDALSEDYDMEGDFGGVDAFGEWMKDSKNRQSVHQEFAKKAGEDYDYDTFSEKLGYGRTSGQGTVAGGVNAATGMPNYTGAMAQGGNMQQMNQQRREAMVRNTAGGAQPNTAVQAGQARTFGPSYEQFRQGFGEYQKRPNAGARGNALGTVAVSEQPEAERTEQGQNEPQNYVEQASQRPQSYYDQAMQPERPAYMTNDEAWEKEQQRQQQSNEQAAYNNEFEAFYQQSAKPVLDAMNEEQKLKWQRNYHERVKQGDPNPYRSYEYQDVAPDVAVKKVSEAVADKMTDFVLMRMGVDPTAANATGTVAEGRPMSQEEVAAFDQMYGEEYERLASALQQKIYDEYVKKGMPRNTIEYVVGSMFHNSLLGTVRDIMLSKLDRSEAIRNQLLNQGLAEYRPNTSEAAVAGAATMMVDAPAFMAGGIFGNLLTKGVAKVGGQLLSKNVMKGLAMVNNNFFSWGGYGAANNYLNGKGQVKENIYKGAQAGDENYFNNAFMDASLKTALAEGAKEGVKGVAIGAMGAGVQYATRNAGRTARIATDIGMVPLEAGAFVTMDMMGAEQPMTAEEIMRDYGQQVMMIGLLHGKGVLMSGGKQYTKDHYDEKGRLVEGAYTADGRVKRELALDMFSDEDLAMLKKGRYGSMFEKAKTAKDMMAIVDEVRVGDYGYDRVMWEGIVEDEAYPYMLRAKMAAAHGKTIAMPRPTQSQIIDESAKGEGFWLTTYTSDGKAVESKHFKTLGEAKKAEKMIAGQLDDQSVMELQDVASCADYTTNEVLEQLVNGDPVRGQRLTEAMERMKAGTANDGDMETIAIVRGIVEDAKKNRRETVLSGAAAEVYESVGIDPREALKKLPDNRTEEDKAAINIYKEKIGEHMAQETMSPEEFAVYMDTDSESGTVKTGVTADGRTVIVKGSGDALRTKDVETGEVKMVDAREVKIVSEMTPAEALEERRRMDAEVQGEEPTAETEGAAPEAQRTEPGTEADGEQPSTAVQGEELEPGALAEAGRKVSFYPTDADVDADAVEAIYLGPDYANPGKHKVQGADGKVHSVYAEDIVMPKEEQTDNAAPEAQRTEQQGMVAEGAQPEAERTGQTQLMMDAQGLPTMQNDPKDVAAHYMSGNGGVSAEESREIVDYMIKDKLEKWQKLQGKKPAFKGDMIRWQQEKAAWEQQAEQLRQEGQWWRGVQNEMAQIDKSAKEEARKQAEAVRAAEEAAMAEERQKAIEETKRREEAHRAFMAELERKRQEAELAEQQAAGELDEAELAEQTVAEEKMKRENQAIGKRLEAVSREIDLDQPFDETMAAQVAFLSGKGGGMKITPESIRAELGSNFGNFGKEALLGITASKEKGGRSIAEIADGIADAAGMVDGQPRLDANVVRSELINCIMEGKMATMEALERRVGIGTERAEDRPEYWTPERIAEYEAMQETNANAMGTVADGNAQPEAVRTEPGTVTAGSAAPEAQRTEPGTVAEKVAEASAEVNTSPTEAQKEAGNYKKGHVRLDGMEISIEQPKGSVRKGVDADGNEWETEMQNTYGYIRGAIGKDGDHIDVFLSDTPELGRVYVVDQVDPRTGEFDEHKVMYGFDSLEEAREAYLSNYEEGWQGLGNITEVNKAAFKVWLQTSKRKTKPFADYKLVTADNAKNERETVPEWLKELDEVPFHAAESADAPAGKVDVAKATEVAKSLGLHVSLMQQDPVDGADAMIDSNGLVKVNFNSPKGAGWLISHESGHRIERLAPEAYKAYKEAALGMMTPEEVQARIEAKRKAYRSMGLEKSDEQLRGEIVNDMIGDIFAEPGKIDELIKKSNPTVWRGIMNAIEDMWAMLTGKSKENAYQVYKKLRDALRESRAAYKKEMSDTLERIETKLARLNHSEVVFESSISNDGNLSSGGSHVDDGTRFSSGAQKDGAKIRKDFVNRKDMTEKMAGFIKKMSESDEITTANWHNKLMNELGFETYEGQNSQYFSFMTPDGRLVSVRMSGHPTQARNYKKQAGDEHYSIVVQVENWDGRDHMKTSDKIRLHEYHYAFPDKERLVDITKSLFGLVDEGKYADFAWADTQGESPRQGGEPFMFAQISDENYRQIIKQIANSELHVDEKAAAISRMQQLRMKGEEMVEKTLSADQLHGVELSIREKEEPNKNPAVKRMMLDEADYVKNRMEKLKALAEGDEDAVERRGRWSIDARQNGEVRFREYEGENEQLKKASEEHMKAVENGDMETAQKLVDEAAKAAGYTIHAYHGTNRADRVGTEFKPERATSGPMSFFADNKEIADNYSKNKKDTSMAYDGDWDAGDYHTQFKVNVGGYAGEVRMENAWGYLPYELRNEITKKAMQVTTDDDGNIITKEGNTRGTGGYDWNLKKRRGNAIKALVDEWLESGNLYNKEGKFMEVLEKAGVLEAFEKMGWKDARYLDPNYSEPKTYDTYLKIEKPFDTNEMYTEKFVDRLENWWNRLSKKKQAELTKESMDADHWDKNAKTIEQWVEDARYDLAHGETWAWTVIPDALTEYLKSKGYDGIVDRGGKGGGTGHNVFIPFYPEQIKSAEAVTRDTEGKVIPLSERFDTTQKDIRYKRTYHGSGADFEEFDHSFMGSGEGSQVYGWGTYVSEVEGIAKTYADIATAKNGQMRYSYVGEKAMPEWIQNDIIAWMDKYGGYEEAKKAHPYPDKGPAYNETVRALHDSKAEDWQGNRKLYEVEIPDDNGENYIGWEETISSKMQKRIEDALYEECIKQEPEAFETENERKMLKRDIHDAFRYSSLTGKSAYGNIIAFLGTGQKGASKLLSEAGFVGVKVPTNNLREGDKSRNNYVIFDEKNAKIVGKEKFREWDENNDGKVWKVGEKFVSLPSEFEGKTESAQEIFDRQRETMPKTAAWSQGMEEVKNNTNAMGLMGKEGSVKRELHRKAKAGDGDAADELVVMVANKAVGEQLKREHPNAVVVYPHAEEASGRNKLPESYASWLETMYGFEVDDSIVQTDKPHHTGANRLNRFLARARYEGDIEAGREYILVDDVYTMGGTLRDMKDYIESKGGKVVAISTLAFSRQGKRLGITAETKNELLKRGITNEQLKEIGIADNIDGLTELEAREIIALADSGRDRGSEEGFEGIARQKPRTLPENEGRRQTVRAEAEKTAQSLGKKINVCMSAKDIKDPGVRASIEKAEKEGRTPTRKGWFNTRTGEIEVYAPAATDVEDVKKTVLHETVGHYGLRELLSDDEHEYQRAMVEMYRLLNAEQKKQVTDSMQRRGWDVATAMDEFLADVAMQEHVPGWWQKAKSIVKNLLRKVGIDVELSDGDLKYMLWANREALRNSHEVTHADGSKSRVYERKTIDQRAADWAMRWHNDVLGLRSRWEAERKASANARGTVAEGAAPEAQRTEQVAARRNWDAERGAQPSTAAREEIRNREDDEPDDPNTPGGGGSPSPTGGRRRSLEETLAMDAQRFDAELSKMKAEDNAGALAADLRAFVRNRMNALTGERIGANAINSIIAQLDAAKKAKDLEPVLRSIKRTLQEAEVKAEVESMLNALNTRTQSTTPKGIAKGIVVDFGTNKVLEDIRGSYKNMLQTTYDDQITAVNQEMRALKAEYGITRKEEGNAEFLARYEELKAKKDELTAKRNEARNYTAEQEIGALEQRQEEIINEINDYVENGKEIPDGLIQERIALPIRMQLADLRINMKNIEDCNKEINACWEQIVGKRGAERKMILDEIERLHRELDTWQRRVVYDSQRVHEELDDLLKEGKSKRAAFVQKDIERQREVVQEGCNAVRMKPVLEANEGRADTGNEKMDTFLDDLKKAGEELKAMGQDFNSTLYSFNYLLKELDRNHHQGQGPLYDRLMRSKTGAVMADDSYREGVKKFNDTVEAKAKEIFGMSYDDVIEDSKRRTDHKIHIRQMEDNILARRGEMIEVDTTKGEAFYIWLTWRQNQGRVKLENAGYTQETINEIEEMLGEKYLEFGKWATDDFMPQMRAERYNPKYEEIYGTTMHRANHYFPIRIWDKAVHQKGDIGENQSQPMAAATNGRIITRTENRLPIDSSQNAFDVLNRYGQEMEYTYAYADLAKDLNTLYHSNAFKNLIEANYGKQMWKNWVDACNVATETYIGSEPKAIGRWLNKAQGSVAKNGIFMRLYTAAKQVTSYRAFAAYSGNIGFKIELIANIGRAFTPWGRFMPEVLRNNYTWAMDHLPAFRHRVEDGNMGIEGLMDDGLFGKFEKKWSKWGMAANKLVDACTVAAGSRAVYNLAYKRAIKNGKSAEEAERIATVEAEICFNESQQSSSPAFSAPVQKDRDLLSRSTVLFQNSNISYRRGQMEGWNDIVRAKYVYNQAINNGQDKKKARKDMLNAMLRGIRKVRIFGVELPVTWGLASAPALFFAKNDEDEKDDSLKKNMIVNALMGMLTNGTIVGTWLNAVLSAGDKVLTNGKNWNSKVNYQAVHGFDVLNEIADDMIEAIASDDSAVLWQTLGRTALRMGGINPETFVNIGLGIEDAIRNGGLTAEDVMFILNVPNSQRKKIVERTSRDESLADYLKDVLHSEKSFGKEDIHQMLPSTKETTEKRVNAIVDQYVKLHVPGHAEAVKELVEPIKAVKERYKEIKGIKNFNMRDSKDGYAADLLTLSRAIDETFKDDVTMRNKLAAYLLTPAGHDEMKGKNGSTWKKSVMSAAKDEKLKQELKEAVEANDGTKEAAKRIDKAAKELIALRKNVYDMLKRFDKELK